LNIYYRVPDLNDEAHQLSRAICKVGRVREPDAIGDSASTTQSGNEYNDKKLTGS